MLDKYDIAAVKDGRFYSESKKCFVEIKDQVFKIGDQTIDLNSVLLTDSNTQKIVYNLIKESTTKQTLEKRQSHAFSKNIYLLGKNTKGRLLWLEAPQWSCDWYWGFGYIETYTNNNNPERSSDIDSHSDFSSLVGQQEYYDHEKGCFRNGDYIHNIYDSPQLIATTFSSSDGWKLSELFKQFYLLQDMAEYTHRTPAGCHLTTSPIKQDDAKMKQWHEEINKVMIPKITSEIIRMLKP
jgi:hypothetical protein